jgi:hypothetical protein
LKILIVDMKDASAQKVGVEIFVRSPVMKSQCVICNVRMEGRVDLA